MSESQNDQKIAREWIQTIENPSSKVRDTDIYPRLAEWVQSVNPNQILEIGCGQGVCSSRIHLDGRNYTGLDISPLLLDRAKDLYSNQNKKFVIGSALSLPFMDNGFDAVFLIAVAHLLPDIVKASAELARVLQPWGSFFIISANPEAYASWIKPYTNTKTTGNKFTGDLPLSDGSMGTETLFLHSRDEILESLNNAGLIIDSVETFRKTETHNLFLQIQGRKANAN